MEIHASTQSNYKTYRRFYLITGFGVKHYKLRRNIIYFGQLSIWIAWGITFLNSSNSWFGFISSSLIFCSMLYTDYIAPKIAYKRGAILFDCSIDFTFHEDEFSFITNSPNHPGTSTIKYSQLDKAYETDNSFYLSLDEKTVYPVEKDGFSLDEVDELRTRLKANLGTKKYIKCK